VLESPKRKERKEGLEGWKEKLCGGLTAIGIAAPHWSAQKIIRYSIFSDYLDIDVQS
jgi:hypothetical protein